MRPSDNGFYIRLVTPKQLSQSEARSWYSLCRRLLPSGVISSMQAVHPTKGIQDARMVHRTLNNSHQYEIPLTRDLLEQETERVVFQWDTIEHNGDFLIETSASQIQAARHQLAGAIDIPTSKYKDFCETLAKHQHARWCSDRTAQGWRYGMQHDANQKTTPLLRPWQDLPQQYQNVDEELPALFLKLLDDLGLAVVDKQEVVAKRKQS